MLCALVTIHAPLLSFDHEEDELPEHFELVPLPGEYQLPVGMAFADDGSFLVITKFGLVHFHDGATLQEAPFLDLRDEVHNNGDRGLLGIALHAGFTPDGGPDSWVYLLYTVSPVFGEDPAYDENDMYSFSRLTRYRAIVDEGNVVADATSREVLLGHQLVDGTVPDGIASLYSTHSNGSLVFAPDGSLLVGIGDGSHLLDTGGQDEPGFEEFVHPVTGLHGPMPQDQDSGAFRAQDLRSLSGKILRIDAETGFGLASNPFYDGDPTHNASRVWALGLRNPFRFSLRPGTGAQDASLGQPGTLLIGDVGWQTWEEIDLSLGGENFGWPCTEGPLPQPIYGAFDAGVTEWDYLDCQSATTGAPTLPLLTWHQSDAGSLFPPVPTFDLDGLPTGGFSGNCAIGGAFYEGGSYPAEYVGRYFFLDYGARWIKTMELDAEDSVSAVRDFANLGHRVLDVQVHPITGDFHFVALDSSSGVGQVRLLRYDPNSTPVAVATATPESGDAPLTVQFDGSGSFDPDDDPLAFAWSFGDGSLLSPLESPQYTYFAEGAKHVVLTVTDPAGRTSTDSLLIGVGNSFPDALLVSPPHGSTTDLPATIPLLSVATDIEDSTLTYEWSVDLYHDTHVHPAVFQSNEQDDFLHLDAHGDVGELYYYKVNLLVSDSGGLEDEEYAFVYPRENFLDITGDMRPISVLDSLSPPTSMGGGNPDIEVVRDGVIPSPIAVDPLLQFDTFHPSAPPDDHWIGYELTGLVGSDTRFVSMFFQEGLNGPNGGWFEDFWVEVRDDDEWHVVQDLLVDPPYPFDLSGQPGFDGSQFNRYELRFRPTHGDAIRLRGVPGGTDRFVSVAELRVGFLDGVPPSAFVDVTDSGEFIARVYELDPPYPTGDGNPDPETMRNGTTPEPGSQSSFAQYDTFHDGDQGQEDWIGLQFAEPMELARVVFQEGLHDAEGGRLASLDVQVRDAGGTWASVAGLTASPPYPGSADLADTYETFDLTFEPTQGTAIRLLGPPEGSIGWISVGELRVFVPYVDPGCTGAPNVASYCESTPNSSGGSATMSAAGCTSVSANDFTVRAEQATPNQFGRFFYGAAQTQMPAGDGFLCVTGGFFRLPVVTIDPMGNLAYSVDFTDPPETGGQILPGSTWNFQLWYRDPGGPGGSGFNFSDGLRATFGP